MVCSSPQTLKWGLRIILLALAYLIKSKYSWNQHVYILNIYLDLFLLNSSGWSSSECVFSYCVQCFLSRKRFIWCQVDSHLKIHFVGLDRLFLTTCSTNKTLVMNEKLHKCDYLRTILADQKQTIFLWYDSQIVCIFTRLLRNTSYFSKTPESVLFWVFH